jgi:L-ascorbate metabolism protein UlaG (beta-lactamase superfamily)
MSRTPFAQDVLDADADGAGGAVRAGGRPRAQRDHREALKAALHGGSAELLGVGGVAAVWLGHATILARLAGRWVLVDPIFSERAGPWITPTVQLGPRRHVPAALALHELPPIDLVLITHAHYDHLDWRSLSILASPRTSVITARHTRGLIPRGFASVQELGWNQRLEIGPLTIRTLKPRHWGARNLWDRHRGFNSYCVSGAESSILFGGDSAHTRAFDRLGAEVPDLVLAALGIGSYEPHEDRHANPEEAWDMFISSGARYMLPMHHSTFPLGKEPAHEPLKRLHAAVGDQGHRLAARRIGELWSWREERTPAQWANG